MKSSPSGGTRERTRRAILEAMVDVIMEADGIGFSVQAVADRAGVTHRTIYNHFPTRHESDRYSAVLVALPCWAIWKPPKSEKPWGSVRW